MYCSFSLYKIQARYRYHLGAPSDEPGSEKRCLFQRRNCLCFLFQNSSPSHPYCVLATN